MKLFKNWEYWSSNYFYIPNLPYAFYLAFKAKSMVFFTAVNPCIKFSGNGTESKFETLKLIPNKQKPVSIFIHKNENIESVIRKIDTKKLQYPLIIKPDIGFRGLLVKQLKSQNDLENYLTKNNYLNLILQEFISFKNECGIFYYRLPKNQNGKITSITLKKFLTVIGDGSSTLNKLIQNDERAVRYLDFLKELHKNKLENIPSKNEEVLLNVIGNHSKGTEFINGNHLISKELEKSIDNFMKQIPNFHYGRLDLKFNSFDKIIENLEFKVLEINGVIAEPTHIYDASKGTYFEALKTIRKHWNILYKIAIQNKKNGYNYNSVSEFLKSIKELKNYTKFVKKHSVN